MNINGFFKCSNCNHFQHTTTFGECEECTYETLSEITEAEYKKGKISLRKTVCILVDLEDSSPESSNWLIDTISLGHTVMDRLNEVQGVTVHSIDVTIPSEGTLITAEYQGSEVTI